MCCLSVGLSSHERAESRPERVPVLRPRSESESERQRARNGASESERDFILEQARKITSESKRATF